MRNNATNIECTVRNTSYETTRAASYCNQPDISFFIRRNEKKKETIRREWRGGRGRKEQAFFSRDYERCNRAKEEIKRRKIEKNCSRTFRTIRRRRKKRKRETEEEEEEPFASRAKKKNKKKRRKDIK